VADINEQLNALKDELVKLNEERQEALVEFGEAALAELRENKEFSEAAAKIDELTEKITEKSELETTLLAEKEKQEREERERIVRLTCFSCNTVNPEGAMFCENCGAKLGELPREYCKECGTMNPKGLKFCGECGKKLEEA